MRARGYIVHLSGSGMTVIASEHQLLIHFLGSANHESGQPLYVHFLVCLLVQLKFFLSVGTQQIDDLLVVQLKHTCLHNEFQIGSAFDGLEDVLERPWNNSFFIGVILISFHSVGLSGSGLPISEDGAIVALQYTFDDGQSCFLEYGLLPDCRFEHHVKREHLIVLPFLIALDRHLSA